MGNDAHALVDLDDIKITKKKENKTKNTQVGCIFCFHTFGHYTFAHSKRPRRGLL
jgi:hypothetical protein